jgi:hypothetical protein
LYPFTPPPDATPAAEMGSLSVVFVRELAGIGSTKIGSFHANPVMEKAGLCVTVAEAMAGNKSFLLGRSGLVLYALTDLLAQIILGAGCEKTILFDWFGNAHCLSDNCSDNAIYRL